MDTKHVWRIEALFIMNHRMIYLEVPGLSLLFKKKSCRAKGLQEKYSCVEGLVLVQTHGMANCVLPRGFPEHPVTAE